MKLEYKVVLGCPRSGTTFLMKCLNAFPHSECVIGHLIPVCVPHIINQPLSPEIKEALSVSFEFAIQDYLKSISKARVSVVARWLNGCMSTQELIKAFQGKRRIDRFVYKEPFLSFAPEFTYYALPNCRIIHIYRDGRDSADSLVRSYNVLTDESLMALNTSEMLLGRKYDHRYVPWWVENGRDEEFLACTPYVRAIWMWKEMVRRCYNFFYRPDVVASGRVLLLKYEDLVNDPLKYGEVAVRHLGCTMNPQLRQQFKKARKSSIGIYRKRESTEIEAAERIAKEELELYGYL